MINYTLLLPVVCRSGSNDSKRSSIGGPKQLRCFTTTKVVVKLHLHNQGTGYEDNFTPGKKSAMKFSALIATAFCSLTVIPSHQSCTVRCHVHSYHPQLRTSGSASYPRATCTTHKHQHSIAHIKQQLIHQQHHIIRHSCHPMPPAAPHTHQDLHTSGCAS